MPLVTGKFWNLDNPKKPWGLADFESDLIYPIEWGGWLADIGGSIGAATVDGYGVFEPSWTVNGTVVEVRIKIAVGQKALLNPGTKYPFTIHVVSDPGSGSQEDDRTFWLKVEER